MSLRQRRFGPQGIGQALPKVTRQLLAKRGFAQSEIVYRWPEIVGPALAALCAPEQIRFGKGEAAEATLRLRVEPAAATELQHLTPQLLERVNGYFGYRAIGRLLLRQAPLPRPPAARPGTPAALSPGQRARLDGLLADLPDGPVRQALQRLGAEILARTESGGEVP